MAQYQSLFKYFLKIELYSVIMFIKLWLAYDYGFQNLEFDTIIFLDLIGTFKIRIYFRTFRVTGLNHRKTPRDS